MKCVVTGGAGFIGSHLVERLVKNGHHVVIFDNFSTGRIQNLKHINKKNVKIFKKDISELKVKNKYLIEADYVFHLAALADIVPSIKNPYDYYKSNVIGTLKILENIKESNLKKFIYAASGSCYGIPKSYPTSENSKIDCQYPYAHSKFIGESLVMHWSKIYNIPSISLRLFNVYGTRSRTSGTYGAVFGVFLAQKLANKPFTIVGNGKQTRDFTYVTDVVDAFIKASKSKITNQIYNVGSGKDVSINLIAKLLDAKQLEYIPKRPGEPDRTFADLKKIKKELKWKPKINIEKGLKYILEDINYWKNAPIWNKKKIETQTKDWFKYIK